MKVTEAAFVGYPVTDTDRAKDFYENVLGLTPEMEHEIESMPGKHWIEYEQGNVTLAISNTWEPAASSGPAIALEVENLETAVARLKEAGGGFYRRTL